MGRQRNTTDVLSDSKLVERAGDNDTWAIEQLVRRYNKKAYSIAYQFCSGDREEAMDLVQDAFLKAFGNIHKFKGKSSFYTWFYRIVVNTCLDAKKRRQRSRKIFSLWRSRQRGKEDKQSIENHPDICKNSDPVSLLKKKELNRDLQNALRLLSKKQRMVFELKIFHEMRIKEIAKIMDMASGTVKSHLFRATRCIRKALKDWEHE